MSDQEWEDFLEPLPDHAYWEDDVALTTDFDDDEEDYGDCNDNYK